MSNVGILGGGGFLGSHLARCLSTAGRDVRVFSRTISRPQPGIGYVRGMVEDQDAVADWLRGCDELLYLAHNSAISPYQDHDRFALIQNVDSFVQTLQTAAAVGVRRVLLMSTGGAIYGPAHERPCHEDCLPAPVSAYGLAKLTMENYLRMFAASHGLSYLILRPSNPYGPGQNGRRNQGVISIFLQKVLRGAPLEVWGDTAITKDYLYISDFVSAAERLMSAGYDNRCYNVCSGHPCSLGDIIAQIRATTGRTVEVRAVAARANDVHHVHLDGSRLHQRIAWRPAVDLAAGIRLTWEWLQSADAAPPWPNGDLPR